MQTITGITRLKSFIQLLYNLQQSCKNQDIQGYFYITGIVQAKDTYEIVKKTLSPGIMKETELLKNSQVIEVTAEGGEVSIIDRTIYLVDKNTRPQLSSRGQGTLPNKILTQIQS